MASMLFHIDDSRHIPSCEIQPVHTEARSMSILNYRGITILQPGSSVPHCSAREFWVLVVNHLGTQKIDQWYIVHGYAYDRVSRDEKDRRELLFQSMDTVAGWGEKLLESEAIKMMSFIGYVIDAPYRE